METRQLETQKAALTSDKAALELQVRHMSSAVLPALGRLCCLLHPAMLP